MSRSKSDPVGSFLSNLADVATAPARAMTEAIGGGGISNKTAGDLIKNVGGDYRDSLIEDGVDSLKSKG
jgi:hypothetical protein